MIFHREVEISPIDLSHIRINLLKNYPLAKMKLGDCVKIQTQEHGESVIYQITKIDCEDYIFKSFEIKKFVFNRALFDMEVQKQLRNPKIEIKLSQDEFKNFIGTEAKQCKS